MGYTVIADSCQTDRMRSRYGQRPGLEGPFLFVNGRVLYYDAKQGQYWDPTTDFYVEPAEIAELQQQMLTNLQKFS
jgi:hypothetical protein